MASVNIAGPDGPVTLAATPAGLVCPATATISGGEVAVSIPILSSGAYTITATQGAQSDTCVVTVPAAYVASETYDLTDDLSQVIMALRHAGNGNAYHYDDELNDADEIDAEDRTFALAVAGTAEGPVVGGKTIEYQALVAYRDDHVPVSDMTEFANYINRYADWPAYVMSATCLESLTQPISGAQCAIYRISIQVR
jgi:hypothetical protein